MKKFMFNKINIFLFFALIAFVACEEDSNPFSSIGDDDEETTAACGDVKGSVKDFYEDDATRLAIGLINQPGSITGNTVLIPPALVERMSDVLTAVHSSEYAARDSVVDVYDVHIFPQYSLDKVVVKVDSDEVANPWVSSWIDGNRFTGNADIDGIVATYDLEISDIVNFDTESVIILESKDLLNATALADAFAGIDGVIEAKTREESGDGDDITVTPQAGEEDSYTVVYKVAYDDCENSCQKARFYEFNVDDNCTVSYVNTYGDEAPDEDDRDED